MCRKCGWYYITSKLYKGARGRTSCRGGLLVGQEAEPLAKESLLGQEAEPRVRELLLGQEAEPLAKGVVSE